MKVILYWVFIVLLAGCGVQSKLDAPNVEQAATGLQATYYDNMDFTGKQIRRVDGTINFDWRSDAPLSSFSADTFSVRWTGSVTPKYSEVYTFIVNADDGVRLWVNGVQIMNRWYYDSNTLYGKLRLSAGQQYSIKLEYHDYSYDARVKLEWQSPSQQREVIGSALSSTTGVVSGLSESSSLRQLAESRGILIGAAVDYGVLQQVVLYRDIAAREFNLLPPDNDFLLIRMHEQANPYVLKSDLSRLGGAVNFALSTNAQVQAYHLVWFEQSAWFPWLNDLSVANRWWLIHERIHQTMKKYKGKVQAYNVVNEAFDDDGKLRGATWKLATATGGASRNWLYDLDYGYLEYSFKEAREADPNAKLFYNDYGLETNDAKWNAVLGMMDYFQREGIPIDGVGFQAHLQTQNDHQPEKLAERFRQLQERGLEARITEMDVGIQFDAGSEADRLAKQAKIYKDYMYVCLAAPNCTAFTLWGFSDKHSWVTSPEFGYSPANKPLIFDSNYQPKLAYYALRDALLGR